MSDHEIDDVSSAFPDMAIDIETKNGERTRYFSRPGMTLRDWFAGQALSGIMASDWIGSSKEAAEMAYEYADSMMDQRKKGKK